MKIIGMRVAAALAACVLVLAMPARLMAQATASIHGHVVNPVGDLIPNSQVRLTQDKNPNPMARKFDYTFPVDAAGDYKGTGIKPGNYAAMVFQGNNPLDQMPAQLTAGDDKAVDFDMTRKAYLSNMDPAELDALRENKKKNAEISAANSKIADLNKMLLSAQTDIKSGSFDSAAKTMTDATAAKPDEAILWETLGAAQLGQADAAAKAAKAAKATDATLADKYGAAVASFQKAISLNAASSNPKPETAAASNNQLGQALGRMALPPISDTEKAKDAAAAYEAAAKADPSKAGTYYYNEAATLYNANKYMDDAAAAADKAIAADPNKVDAYYIKAQALVQKATFDPKTNKITAPPECVEAYQKYLELAPTGPHADEVKGILAGLNEPIKSTFKAGKK
jgi:tetratricopeptide (TPR) repeat protein